MPQAMLPALARSVLRATGSVAPAVGCGRRLWAATTTPSRFFHATPCAADSGAFKEAVARVRAANTDNATLLNLYALFKQATVGVNDTPKPSMLDFVVRELNELARTDDWLRVLAAHTAPPA